MNPLPLNQASIFILLNVRGVVNCDATVVGFRPWPRSAGTGGRLKYGLECGNFMAMKHWIATAVLLLLLAAAGPAAEIKLLLGMNSSKYLFSDDVTSLNLKQKSGLALGLGYAFEIDPKMVLEADVVYNEKGARSELAFAPDSSIPGIYRNTSLGIPLLFKYRLNQGASPYAALGPEFVFILSHHLEIPDLEETVDISDNTKNFVMAFNILLGYELPLGPWRLFAEVRFNRWLGNFLVDPEARARTESVALVIGGATAL